MSGKFEHVGFFLLRTPRLQASTIQKLNGFTSKKDVWEFIRCLWAIEEVREAFRLSSEILFEELDNDLEGEYDPQKNRLLVSAYKYINRMAGRSTPFGRFAGVSTGTISQESTDIQLSEQFFQVSRVDSVWFNDLIRSLKNEKSVVNLGKYFTNNTLYEKYDRYYYLDYTDSDRKRLFNWVWVRKNPLLELVFQFAKPGMFLEDISHQLIQLGVVEHQAGQFLQDLIDANLLLSEFELSTQVDFTSKGLIRLPDVSQKTSSKSQVDLIVGTNKNRVQEGFICEIAKELKELSVLSHSEKSSDMIEFCKDFNNRYGDRQIPLLEAINPETGIGYGTKLSARGLQDDLLNGLSDGKLNKPENHVAGFVKSRMDHWQFVPEKIREKVLQIKESDLQKYNKKGPVQELPLGFYALGNLLLDSKQIHQDHYFFNVLASGGVSSIPLMTRFAHLDENLKYRLEYCAQLEESQMPNAVLAEIVCVPDSKAANILARPSFYKFEIPILGQSTVEEKYQIRLDDLYVSIRDQEVFLWSKRLSKRVYPRLSSAHNFHNSMDIYRFLCDLQGQTGALDFSWNWGTYSTLPFTPRVIYKHLILARATWNITQHEYVSNLGSKEISEIIKEIKGKYQLPDVIVLCEGDHEIILDLRNPVAVDILISQLKKGDVVLKEYLFDSFRSPVSNQKGDIYNNELIIPFQIGSLKQDHVYFQQSPIPIQRRFAPGSDWTFLKIYSSPMYGEELLRERIPSLINELKSIQLLKKWFMIRYDDPEPHIRIRFQLQKISGIISYAQLTELVNLYLEPLIQNEMIHKLVYDTYDRELERYGMQFIEQCESIFHIDSEAVLGLIQIIDNRTDNQLRWLAGMKGIDDLFNVFGLLHTEKLDMVVTIRDNFINEFKSYNRLIYKMDLKYRQHRTEIERFFKCQKEHVHEQIHFILETRKQRMAAVFPFHDEIKPSLRDHPQLLPSLAHMFVNRLFPLRQREYEMVLFHLLFKYYRSILHHPIY